MIAIATHLRAQVLLMPIIKQQMIVVLLLAAPPGVERFVHHQEAHAISEIEQLRRGRIVTGANRIDAHLLQNFQLPFERSQIQRGTQRSEIVMIADALKLYALAVQQETAVSIEINITNAKNRFILVDDSSAEFN